MQNKYSRRLISVLLLISVFLTGARQQVHSQSLVNNKGAQVTVKKGAIVIVKTDSIHNHSGRIDNEGTVKIEGAIINDDTMTGGNTTGVYDLDENWVNNAAFIADSSTVFFKGANQLITGTSVTAFFNLDLQGTGIKTQTLDALTMNELFLNDRELATDSFTMLITNSDTGAINRTSGFVSSLDTGRLAWRTNRTDPYLFPVGSSVGTQRYRPVELTPTSSSQNTYGVRMANVDPTSEGFDRTIKEPSICNVNSRFFHRIYQQSSSNNANIKLFYDPTTDGIWRSIGHWQNMPRWENIGAPTSGSQGVFNTLSVNNWSNFTFSAFAFTNPKVNIDSFTVSQISCFGAANGAIDLHVSGGASPINYNWSNSDTTQDISGLAPGAYSVTVTDSLGCFDTLSVTIQQPDTLVVTDSVIDVSCFGANDGEIHIGVSGGTTPYSFNWSNGSSSQNLTGLSGGTFILTVTDSNGCTANHPVTVNEPDSLSLQISAVNASCNGAADGSLSVSVTGGTSPYNFSWSTGSDSAFVDSLAAGTYIVTVTDSNGCTKSASASVGEPQPISISANVTDVSCHGGADGSITLSVSGGTPAYSFLWSNGATTPSINNISGGNYGVTVTDANGCSDTSQIRVAEPDSISLSTVATNATCFGGNDGAIDLSVSGGTPGYNYNWSNGSTNQDLSNITAGAYTVTVSDANNCTATLTEVVTQPDSISISETITDVSCNGNEDGRVVVNVTGGTGPGTYNFNWSTSAADTNAVISNVSAGNYSLTITDGNNCTKTASFSVNQPSSLSLSLQSTNIQCAGNTNGTATAQANGGVGGFQYMWSNGDTDPTTDSLGEGTFAVTAIDTNGCAISDSTIISEPSPLTAQAVDDTTIAQGYTANLGVTTQGGTGALQFQWSPVSSLDQSDISDPQATPESTTNYTVTVTDDNGCTTLDSVTVEVDEKLFNHPEAFSPNGDGQNDKFYVIKSVTVEVESFKVFNRWGQLLHDQTKPWDGTYQGEEQAMDTYVYQTKIKLPDGSIERVSGQFVLVR